MILHHCVKMPHTASITIASSHPVSTAEHITPAQSPQPILWYTIAAPLRSSALHLAARAIAQLRESTTG
jgi:hypothetical protein